MVMEWLFGKIIWHFWIFIMANSEKMNMADASPSRLLYWCHDIDYTTTEYSHTHPFWQIEIWLKGQVEAETSLGCMQFAPGDIFIIPPENQHLFRYKGYPQESYSFKFELDIPCENFAPLKIENQSFARNICDTFHSLLKDEKEANLFISAKRILVEYLLRDIVHYRYCLHKAPVAEAEFVRMARELVCTHGKGVNVASVAERLGWSSGHLKLKFKKELGIPVKRFIDGECLKLAQKHLEYSEHTISVVAEMTHFPDVYAFSRFFKRMTGLSPLAFRAKARRQKS